MGVQRHGDLVPNVLEIDRPGACGNVLPAEYEGAYWATKRQASEAA